MEELFASLRYVRKDLREELPGGNGLPYSGFDQIAQGSREGRRGIQSDSPPARKAAVTTDMSAESGTMLSNGLLNKAPMEESTNGSFGLPAADMAVDFVSGSARMEIEG